MNSSIVVGKILSLSCYVKYPNAKRFACKDAILEILCTILTGCVDFDTSMNIRYGGIC
jgi:hypothetical protein